MEGREVKKISVVFGTRPEAVKLAPVVLALRRVPGVECRVCVTGQHREMLDQVLEVFGVQPDTDFNLIKPNQDLAQLTARAIRELGAYLASEKPDLAIVQGDTTTVLSAALAAFYERVPLAHVEAGLRSGDMTAPWPEEANRVLTTRLASLHFAPTAQNRDLLLKEGVPESSVCVTGNTVIDALFLALERIGNNLPAIDGLPPSVAGGAGGRRQVLVTAHRRESFGRGLLNICEAVRKLAECFPDVDFIYPVHMNPSVTGAVDDVLRAAGLPNVHLLRPLPYLQFVSLMSRCYMLLTDSGGLQEEAPSLDKPVLVMRSTTERQEAVTAGTVRLVGTETDTIFEQASGLLTDPEQYASMAAAKNPYGDGRACERIVTEVRRFLKLT